LSAKNLPEVPRRGTNEGEISATGYDLIAVHLAGLKAPDTNPAFTPHFLPSVEYAPQLMVQWRVAGMLPVQLQATGAPPCPKMSQNVPFLRCLQMGHPSEPGAFRFSHKLAVMYDWLDDYSIGELWEKNVIGAGPLP
jgi:hypothetical protein